MPRQRILALEEQALFDTPPEFSASDRKKYFFVSQALSEILASIRSPGNQTCLLLLLGYFRATQRFYGKQYHPRDLAYVTRQLGVSSDTDHMSSYGKDTSRRHRALILQHLGFRPFDDEARRHVTAHLLPLIRSQVRPKVPTF
jgi:Domain of unknown function (DUF4158)